MASKQYMNHIELGIKGEKMDNEKRLQNYLKQKGTTNKDALSFRQKRRIRKNWKKHESS